MEAYFTGRGCRFNFDRITSWTELCFPMAKGNFTVRPQIHSSDGVPPCMKAKKAMDLDKINNFILIPDYKSKFKSK